MESQKLRSREASKAVDLTAGLALGDLAQRLGSTAFIGYEHGPLRAAASVLAILRDGQSVESASAGVRMHPICRLLPWSACLIPHASTGCCISKRPPHMVF